MNFDEKLRIELIEVIFWQYLGSLYDHLIRKHTSPLKFTRAGNKKLLRFRPFDLIADTVTHKNPTQQVLNQLKALHDRFKAQAQRGLTFFHLMEEARARKRLNTSHFVDSTVCAPSSIEEKQEMDTVDVPITTHDPIDSADPMVTAFDIIQQHCAD